MRSSRFGSLALLLAAIGCGEAAPVAEPGSPTSTLSAELRSDASTGGTAGFNFLPPLVPPVARTGPLAYVPVTIAVDALDASGNATGTVATFSTTSSGLHRVYTENFTDSYVALWVTRDEDLVPGNVYRVRVLGPARELGFIDVQVAASRSEMRAINRDEYVPLQEGHTLLIRFRIQQEAVDRDGDGVLDQLDVCPDVADADQLDTDADGVGDACECDHVVCALGNDGCHQPARCERTTGACVYDPVDDGTACDDGNACTLGESCLAGVCTPAAAIDADQLQDDPSNCGACGNVCPDDAPLCSDGLCVPENQPVQITAPGEAYGHHGSCYGWNACGDAATCAQWACQANGFSTLVSYGASGSCTGFDTCSLLIDGPDGGVERNWGNFCDVFGVTDVVCTN